MRQHETDLNDRGSPIIATLANRRMIADMLVMQPDVTDPGYGLTGRLLIASPALSDSYFAQSVIYVCAHSPSVGAMGIVVNKRLSDTNQNDVFTQLGIMPQPPKRQIGLGVGGPLDHTRGLVLHSADWHGDGSLTVDSNISLTASLDILRDIAAGHGPRKAILAMGHAAWEPGQLEDEMIRDNAWLSAPASEQLLFGGDNTVKWRRALAAINMDPLMLPDVVGHA